MQNKATRRVPRNPDRAAGRPASPARAPGHWSFRLEGTATRGPTAARSPGAAARKVLPLTLALCLAACGGSSDTSSTTQSVTPVAAITAPTTINLYPHQSSTESPLITVLVTSVGAVAVRMPLGFDTGSAGVTLYAQSIFPASIVSESGFVFPAGETSFTYNGITVTNVQGTRSYGTVNTTVEHGNLGFATLTFGDCAGEVVTQTMPVFLFYSIDYTSGNGYKPPLWQGWFGVAATNDAIDVAGSVEPAQGYDACTQTSTTTCYLTSAMKHIDYGSAVNAGFILGPVSGFPTCDITTPGSCSAQGVLTVGIDPTTESLFSTSALTCPPKGYTGPSSIAGFPVCQKAIDNVTVAVSGASIGSYTGDVVFDSGTAYEHLSTPASSSFPEMVTAGSTVTLTTPSGLSYSYTAGSGTADTLVAAGANGNSIMGVQYFTTNALLFDFTSSLIGWK